MTIKKRESLVSWFGGGGGRNVLVCVIEVSPPHDTHTNTKIMECIIRIVASYHKVSIPRERSDCFLSANN